MEIDKKNFKSILWLIIICIIVYVGLQNIPKVTGFLQYIIQLLFPFIMGGFLAFIINVPMRIIEDKLFGKVKNVKVKKFKRLVSLLLTIIILIVILLFVMFMIVPQLVATITILAKNMPGYLNNLMKQIQTIPISIPEIQDWISQQKLDWNSIGSKAIKILQSGVGNVFSSTVSVVASIINGFVNFILAFIFAIYILLKKEDLARQGKQVIYAYLPMKIADGIVKVLRLSETTFSNFLSGQCVEAVILGTMFFLTMSIFHFSYALLVGVLIAFTALIPIFGAFIGSALGFFLILMVDPIEALWFLLLFFVLQQIEGNLIYPHVVGGSVGLPSIWVLVAVTIGGSLMGVVGMLINIPLCSVIYSLVRESVANRLHDKKLPPQKWE